MGIGFSQHICPRWPDYVFMSMANTCGMLTSSERVELLILDQLSIDVVNLICGIGPK